MAEEFEVEVKYRLTPEAIARVAELGCKFGDPVHQCDTYFAHPQRNFKETDEALRIRQLADQAKVTYKGPKLDQTTKTRRELEFAIHDANELAALFEVLGFHAVRSVRKQRRHSHLVRDSRNIEICWDEVEGLGAFLEIETTAVREDLDAATQAILNLAAELGFDQSERRGYLDLLLDGE